MKKLKIICIWAMMSLMVQTAILFYLGNYYFSDKTRIAFKNINQAVQPRNNNIKLPQEATNIKVSSTGRHAMYCLKDALHVVNLMDGKDNAVDLNGDLKNNFVKWHEGEDKLIIAEKRTIDGGSGSGVKISTYQAKDNSKQYVLDFNNESRTYKLPSKISQVTDIQLNTLNTIVYVKSSYDNASCISRLDISDEMRKLPIKQKNIGNYYVVKQQDKVVFEDSSRNKVYVWDSSRTEEVAIDGVHESKLLNVDNDGIVYIGHLENGKIKAVFHKNYTETDNSKWEKMELKTPLESKDIHMFDQGDIYAVDNMNGTVTNLKNNKETKFEGAFQDMSHNGILSLKEQKVVYTDLKQ